MNNMGIFMIFEFTNLYSTKSNPTPNIDLKKKSMAIKTWGMLS